VAIRDLEEFVGFVPHQSAEQIADSRSSITRYIVLKLLANGLPVPPRFEDHDRLGAPRLLSTYHHRLKRLDSIHCPVDARIEGFLRRYFDRVKGCSALRLPDLSIILDRHGIARELSLPHDADQYTNRYGASYRVRNGVLHNPANDRRTTEGTFHVVEGGLAIPRDKKAVPKITFAALFRHAMNPPEDLLQIPFTSREQTPAKAFVSLLIRPVLCPEVGGFCNEQSMEVRFFAPGALVSNLDFVESIFGNAGDPFLPANDSALDVEHWSGHTGCVILAPHLVDLTKKELGLPHYDEASDRQRQDGMCWKTEDEKYNDGQAFKLTCRDEEGVIVTLIADNAARRSTPAAPLSSTAMTSARISASGATLRLLTTRSRRPSPSSATAPSRSPADGPVTVRIRRSATSRRTLFSSFGGRRSPGPAPAAPRIP